MDMGGIWLNDLHGVGVWRESENGYESHSVGGRVMDMHALSNAIG